MRQPEFTSLKAQAVLTTALVDDPRWDIILQSEGEVLHLQPQFGVQHADYDLMHLSNGFWTITKDFVLIQGAREFHLHLKAVRIADGTIVVNMDGKLWKIFLPLALFQWF